MAGPRLKLQLIWSFYEFSPVIGNPGDSLTQAALCVLSKLLSFPFSPSFFLPCTQDVLIALPTIICSPNSETENGATLSFL